MVRTLRKILILVALAVILVQPISASAVAYTLYDGNISTTYITIFEDIATKIPIDEDYVFFRSGQYEYLMVVGDIDFTSNKFTSSDTVTVYSITTGTSNYNSYYNYDIRTETNFSLTPSNGLVYSNLGNYPDLIDRSDNYALATILLLLVGLGCYLIRSIFVFCLRSRNLRDNTN